MPGGQKHLAEMSQLQYKSGWSAWLVFVDNPNQGQSLSLRTSLSEQQTQRLNSGPSCHLRELELCAVGFLSIVQNPNGLPASEPELKRQCEYFNESAACFDDYGTRCLSELQLPLAQLFTRDLVDLGEQFCTPGSELRRNYTKQVGCLRDIQRKYQRPCLTDFQVAFEPIHKLSNRSQIIPLTCCNVNRLKECLLGRIEQECGQEAIDLVEWLLDKVAGPIVQLPCRSYDPFEAECGKLLPEINTKPYNGRNTSALSRLISGFTNVPAQF